MVLDQEHYTDHVEVIVSGNYPADVLRSCADRIGAVFSVVVEDTPMSEITDRLAEEHRKDRKNAK